MVVPSPADGFPDDLEGYVEQDPYQNHWAAVVSSKVPNRRIFPYICIQEYHITPHMIKVNLMAKFNTLPDQDLNDIEKSLNIWTFEGEKWRKVKIDSRRNFDI